MKSYSFTITDKDGTNFSKLSGDFNKIHLNDLYAYNTLFGEKICHGCLVIINSFKKTKILKNIYKNKKFNINIKFIKHFVYNKKINLKFIKKNKNITLNLYQEKDLSGIFNISFENSRPTFNNLEKFKKKEFSIKKKNNDTDLFLILRELSKYVGMYYPGENSIIKSININYNTAADNKKKMYFFSKQIDKRLPLITNEQIYKNYNISFETLIRPKLNIKLNEVNIELKKKIKNLKNNILIIGASSGIGHDVLNLFKINKKIRIFATYFKNKIYLKRKNIKLIKVDINKDFNVLLNIIKRNSPVNIYYFATPKINAQDYNANLNKLYENYYVKIPIKIINKIKNSNNNFFYPSTIYNYKKSSYVTKKLKAEKLIEKYNKMYNNKLKYLKIEEINTKQNLSILSKNYINFRNILQKNKKYQKEFFID